MSGFPATVRACQYPGCPELTTAGHRCPDHALPATVSQRGYSAAWKAFAAAWLVVHPTCVRCRGRAEHVDHIIPLSSGVDPFDSTNVRSMCARCHGWVTVTTITPWRSHYGRRT